MVRRAAQFVCLRPAVLAGSVALVVGLALAGCRDQAHEAPIIPSRPLGDVLATHTPELMKTPGVVGTAEARLDDGHPCILVMVVRLTPELRARLPQTLEGWPVRVQETGEIHALPDSGR